MSCGANRIPTSVTTLMKTAVSVATLLPSRQADSSPSVAIFFEKVVMNAVESAPSATRSRSKFGNRNAIRNASRFLPAPKSPAKACSRINPSTREHITAMPTTPVARVLTRWGSAIGEQRTTSANLRKEKLRIDGVRLSSESGRGIQKLPRQLEAFREMRGERFHAEGFSRVMAAQKKIDSEFFRGDRSPMRRLAGNEGVDLIGSNSIDFRAAGAGDDADPGCFFRSEIERLDRSAQNSSKLADQFCSRRRMFDSQPNQLPFFFQEGLGRFES